ncbi:MAG: MFS transporter [Candidatus Thermoplasmatota archaeon]|nr:MFS transporter [Candidatus Thermoplasmatota archaeon]
MKGGITRTVLIFGLVSLLTDASSEMIIPLIPFFIISLGGGGLAVGLVEGTAEAIAGFLKVYSGWKSDGMTKRRPLVITGYGLSSASKTLFALSPSWPIFAILRSCERVGKGLRNSPRDALIAQDSCKGHRGAAFGFHRAMDTLGAVIGVLILYFLLDSHGFREIFILSAIPSTIGVAIIFLVREKKRRPKREKKIIASISKMPSRVKTATLSGMIFSLSGVALAFPLLRAADANFSTQEIVLLYMLFNITYSIAAYPLGRLSDSIGKRPIIIGGYVFSSAIFAFFALPPNPLIVIVLFGAYGLYFASTEGVLKALISDLSPPDKYGSFLGGFSTSVSLSALPGGLVAGLLWQVDHSLTFIYASLLSLIALSVFVMGTRRKR